MMPKSNRKLAVAVMLAIVVAILGVGYVGAQQTYYGEYNVAYMMQFVTALTPDSLLFATNSTANSIHLSEYGDIAYDFNNGSAGTSAQTDPALIIHSANQSTSEYLELRHDQTDGVITTGTGGLYGWRRGVTSSTTGATLTEAQSGRCFTDVGDTDGTAWTLPNDPSAGVWYCFAVVNVAAAEMSIVANTGEFIYFEGDYCIVDLTSTTFGDIVYLQTVYGGNGSTWIATGSFTCNDA